MSRAVVLGGGGGTGIAWEVGLIQGLRDGGIDLNDADLIVGTSAGANVGAQLRLGRDWEALYAAQSAPPGPPPEHLRRLDPARLSRMMQLLENATERNAELGRKLGQLALEPGASAGEPFVTEIAGRLGTAWPEKALITTGVDVMSGEAVAFDGASGVPLDRAVAISMCVPGMVEPISVGDRLYMDGGMAGLNTRFAAGHDVVVVVSTRDDPLTRAEMARFRGQAAAVVYVPPDAESAEALGEGEARFAAARRGPAAAAGRRQGRAEAESLRRAWMEAG